MTAKTIRLYEHSEQSARVEGNPDADCTAAGWDYAVGATIEIDGAEYVLTEVSDSIQTGDDRGNYIVAEAEPTAEWGYEFVDVGPALGDVPADEYEAECAKLDGCYTRVCEGTPYSILARPARRGEASGTYAEDRGALQILGYTIPIPERVHELQEAAWKLYCGQ